MFSRLSLVYRALKLFPKKGLWAIGLLLVLSTPFMVNEDLITLNNQLYAGVLGELCKGQPD